MLAVSDLVHCKYQGHVPERKQLLPSAIDGDRNNKYDVFVRGLLWKENNNNNNNNNK